ncbi:MAG TPA: hypothetical protein PKI40_04070 [Methanomassiliicoccaceae archaeon]|nr:hypothetical protein [Methanomassiliicoccaceae archaeon]
MKALVVYDAAKGGADRVGEAICAGMRQMGIIAECKAAADVTSADLQDAEVLIVGSPNGFLAGRKAAKVIKSAAGRSGLKGIAFETRAANSPPGSLEKLASMMSANGITLLGKTYFSLGANNALMDGEKDMAEAYGRNLPNLL